MSYFSHIREYILINNLKKFAHEFECPKKELCCVSVDKFIILDLKRSSIQFYSLVNGKCELFLEHMIIFSVIVFLLEF